MSVQMIVQPKGRLFLVMMSKAIKNVILENKSLNA